MNGRPVLLLALAVLIAIVIIGIPFIAPDLLTRTTESRDAESPVPAIARDLEQPEQTMAPTTEGESNATGVEAAGENQERLIAIPPTNWQTVYQLNTGQSRMVEMIPGDESEDDWVSRLTFESNQDLVRFDPITLLDGESDDLHTRCEFVRWYPVFSDFENGYPTSVRMFMCGKHRQTGRGEVSLFKIVQGDDYLYSIRFQRRVAAFELEEPEIPDSEIADFSDYLRRVIVCNGTPDHPCPGGPTIPTS